MNKIVNIITLTLLLTIGAAAQVASGGNFTLNQSVIGSGGQNSTGGTFSLDGTIGQAVAGTASSNSPYSVSSGFWSPQALAPTAASVSIFGRVLTADGIGLFNARVSLTSADGTVRIIPTSSFGHFTFNDVQVGQTYILQVVSRRYEFAPQVVFISDDNYVIDFTAIASKNADIK